LRSTSSRRPRHAASRTIPIVNRSAALGPGVGVSNKAGAADGPFAAGLRAATATGFESSDSARLATVAGTGLVGVASAFKCCRGSGFRVPGSEFTIAVPGSGFRISGSIPVLNNSELGTRNSVLGFEDSELEIDFSGVDAGAAATFVAAASGRVTN